MPEVYILEVKQMSELNNYVRGKKYIGKNVRG